MEIPSYNLSRETSVRESDCPGKVLSGKRPQPATQPSKRNLKHFYLLNFTRCDIIYFVFLTILPNCRLLRRLVSSCCKLSLSAIIMVALCNRADHYIFALWFLSFFYLSSFFLA